MPRRDIRKVCLNTTDIGLETGLRVRMLSRIIRYLCRLIWRFSMVSKARRNSTGTVSLRRGAGRIDPPVECRRPPSTSNTPRPYPAPSTFHVLKIEACNVDVSNISPPQDTKHNVHRAYVSAPFVHSPGVL